MESFCYIISSALKSFHTRISMSEDRNSPFHIRYATASDNFLLSEVGAETFYDSFAAENTPENMAAYLAESFSSAKQAEELANPASKFLIVEKEGQTVGYAHLKFGQAPAVILSQRPMEIGRFYARKAWIGKGVGAFLMQACLRDAAHANCDIVWLDVWEKNPRAIAFYRKWCFVEVGEQVFKLGDDLQHDLLMARSVIMESASYPGNHPILPASIPPGSSPPESEPPPR
jgi:diamine N-acetyltransferase